MTAAPTMPISILTACVGVRDESDVEPDPSYGDADIDGNVSMCRTSQTRRRSFQHTIVTPGELVTEDPQWMRGHGTYLSEGTSIVSAVAGKITKTNKLLSVRALRARYSPEVGDLVVGRIVEVQAKRWRVDIGSTQLANLPLSAINLPGGILRRRTDVDELQIRAFFAEGDLLVAEVQQLFVDGSAVLHTRSLKYGKLRNGVFMAVTGAGGSSAVVRSRRQMWTVEGAHGAGKIDLVFGVNGYIWICQHVESYIDAAPVSATGITNVEEIVSATMYSSQNDELNVDTMREITRIRSMISVLVEHGLRIDEDTVTKAYRETIDLADLAKGSEDDVYLGGDKGTRLIASLKAKVKQSIGTLN